MNVNNEKDRNQGCLIGLAVGDAVGTTLEFKRRDTYEHLTDMVGGGPFSLPVGAWTDDTSMALCLAVSLLESQGFSAQDQMQKYCNWWHNGYMSSTDECFDIGGTVSAALSQFETTGEPMSGATSSHSAGEWLTVPAIGEPTVSGVRTINGTRTAPSKKFIL